VLGAIRPQREARMGAMPDTVNGRIIWHVLVALFGRYWAPTTRVSRAAWTTSVVAAAGGQFAAEFAAPSVPGGLQVFEADAGRGELG
jgi:hypothetical protein